MKIIHRYVLRLAVRNFCISLLVLCFLFLAFDFFDRIDNILEGDPSFLTIISYFFYKVPFVLNSMFPIAMLLATLFTIGMLSKNSEITAMRSAGLRVLWIGQPILVLGLVLSFLSILLGETLVPHAQRRVREIYNIDIRKKHESGAYSQENFWWRSDDEFYSVGEFDSRSNRLLEFSSFTLGSDFEVEKRVDAGEVQFVDAMLGWNMRDIIERTFEADETTSRDLYRARPLLLAENPRDFYSAKMDPHTMSFLQLGEFIKKQTSYGISISGYLADLHGKLAFPFVIFLVTVVALPFSLLPSRSGSMAPSLLIGLALAFSYYAVHSFSLAMGRAELWPSLLAAWMANLLIGAVGIILNLGAESPS